MKISILSFSLLTVLMFTFNLCSSQPFLLSTAPSGNNIGEGDVVGNAVTAIGIGEFVSNTDEPQAALDVRVPYLTYSNVYNPAEAFQTTTERDYGAVWRMFIGRHTRDPREEKFHILNPPGNSNDIELNVVQRGNMDFYTSNTHWMQLRSDGNVGISNTWSPFTPVSLLHLNQAGNAQVWQNFTNANSGVNSTDGFQLGIDYNSGYPGSTNKSFAKLIQHENAPMKFYTKDVARMIINADYAPTIHSTTLNTTGYVGIGAPNFWGEETGGEGPRTLLHLQGPYNAYPNGGLGWRSWNKTGVYINENSDEIYIGLKDEAAVNGTNRSDAVIMWGDDQYTVNDGNADNFRLIFSGTSNGSGNGGSNPRDPQTFNGLETMRMTALGKMGIGPLFTWSTPPARRLELLDYQSLNGTSNNEPQLRLTYTQATSSALNTTGKWTDFRATTDGHLLVIPKNTTSAGNVGIGLDGSTGNIPTQTLDVNGNARIRGLTTGTNSFLITGEATSGSDGTLHRLNFSGNSGQVLLGDGTWGSLGAVSGVSACSGVHTNFLPKFDASSNICRSLLFDNGTYVGLGLTAGLFSRLQIGGLGTTFSTIGCLIQDSNGDDYFQARDNGHVVIGSGITNKDGRLGIGISYDPEAALIVKTYKTNTSGSPDRAMEVRNGNDAKMLSVWADEHVTMGFNSIPTPSSYGDARLFVNGNGFSLAAHFDGDIYVNGLYYGSDSTLKKNVRQIQDVSTILKNLNPKIYEFDTINYPSLNLPSGNHFGLYAQEVERILPNLVAEQVTPAKLDTSGNVLIPEQRFKSINYVELIPILLQAIKQQSIIIDSLSQNDSLIFATLADFRSQVNSCCSSPNNRVGSGVSTIDVELSSENAIILNQNDPNPFNERTRISYNIPVNVKKAEIIFYTSKGIVLKSVVIDQRGAGDMNVFASDLSTGIYMYSLVADGKTIDSKKMICTK